MISQTPGRKKLELRRHRLAILVILLLAAFILLLLAPRSVSAHTGTGVTMTGFEMCG